MPCTTLWPAYQRLAPISSGTFGTVFKALSEDGREWALKQLDYLNRQETQGFPITALREIKLLERLDHPNILRIEQVVYSMDRRDPPKIYLVSRYMKFDLAGLSKKETLPLPVVRAILKQALQGLAYLHEKQVMHRDIKTANILLDAGGVVKLADFGLAKELKGRLQHTPKVVTLWYRAPELLLGSPRYGEQIDVWALGLVAIELLIGRPLFLHASEAEVIRNIFELIGTPDSNYWEEGAYLPLFGQFNPGKSIPNTLI